VHAGALQFLGIGARAARLSDFWGNGFHTAASADGVVKALAHIVVGVLSQLGFKVILTHFGSHKLGTARAHLEMQTTALITNRSNHFAVAAAAAVRLANATTEGGANLRLHSLVVSAIANRILHATTSLVGGFNLCGLHGLGRAGRGGTGVHMMMIAWGLRASGVLIALGSTQEGFTL